MVKALELIDKVGLEPTLDVALDRDRSAVTTEHLRDTITALRMERAFIRVGKKAKKETEE